MAKTELQEYKDAVTSARKALNAINRTTTDPMASRTAGAAIETIDKHRTKAANLAASDPALRLVALEEHVDLLARRVVKAEREAEALRRMGNIHHDRLLVIEGIVVPEDGTDPRS